MGQEIGSEYVFCIRAVFPHSKSTIFLKYLQMAQNGPPAGCQQILESSFL